MLCSALVCFALPRYATLVDRTENLLASHAEFSLEKFDGGSCGIDF
jgi:hypothetical protein